MAGEFIASWMMGFFGLMLVCVAVINNAITLYQLSILFGAIVAFCTYVTASVSGTHMNPAVTLSMALFGGFPKKRIIPYWIAQILGWMIGTLCLYFVISGMINSYEAANGIIRGTQASQVTSMIFHCYAPHPLIAASYNWGAEVMPTWKAILFEIAGTMLMMLVIYVVSDAKNSTRPHPSFSPIVVGLVVGFLVVIMSPSTMASLNPARDLGPRITTWLLGWGETSFPGPPSGEGGPWYIFTVGPLIGGIVGGAVWKYIIHPLLPDPAPIKN